MASFGLAETLLNTFVPLLEGGVKTPICARWNVLVESGRISCSSPNLLNPPAGNEGVRECFRARPGFVYANADYSVIELRALAQICYDLFGKSRLREIFLEGGDPHLTLAANTLQCSLEEAKTRMVPTGYTDAAGNPETVSIRKFCKVQNFGLAGGMGAATFVDYAKQFGFSLTEKEAERRRQVWFNTFPEMRLYFQWISSLVPHDHATIKQLRSGRIRGGVHFTSAANTQFQGLTADGAKRGLWLIAKECFLDVDSPLFGSRPVVHLYDENLLEVPEVRATEAVDRMVKLMIQGMQETIPDVPITVGEPVLMRRWSKEARSERVNGKLTVWNW
jgi:DNA polymerase-1